MPINQSSQKYYSTKMHLSMTSQKINFLFRTPSVQSKPLASYHRDSPNASVDFLLNREMVMYPTFKQTKILYLIQVFKKKNFFLLPPKNYRNI